MMKKILLPMAVLAVSGTYVFSQQSRLAEGEDAVLRPAAAAITAPPADPTPVAGPTPGNPVVSIEPIAPVAPAVTPPPVAEMVASVVPPQPATRPASLGRTGVLLAAATSVVGVYADGTYTGPASNAYYGLVQVAAEVQGGRLVAVDILQYPDHRRTSRAINSQALPILRQEAIVAQSGAVDFVSGATLTSDAFRQSLQGALAKARS